jgi:cell filamentation protein
MSGYNYEYEWDSKYCYPNSYVLKNKLGIQNAEDLSEVERRITSLNILELKDKPARGKLDLKHLRDIHYAIFHDIFTWAGQLRTVDIAKGNQFCLSQHIESYANGVFTKLKEENWLLGKSVNEMPERLTYYLSEINVLHPFREGNGRTQRVFIEYLAQCTGFYVDFSQVDSKEMVEASALSFAREYRMMTEMFRRILTPIISQEQKAFRKKIGIDQRTLER